MAALNSLVRKHWHILAGAMPLPLCGGRRRLGAVWVGALMDTRKTGPSCRPVGSEGGAKQSGSVKERGFSHPGVGERRMGAAFD